MNTLDIMGVLPAPGQYKHFVYIGDEQVEAVNYNSESQVCLAVLLNLKQHISCHCCRYNIYFLPFELTKIWVHLCKMPVFFLSSPGLILV